MRIGITGAAGHLGRLVARFVLEQVPSRAVRLITRRPEALEGFQEKGVEVVKADFDRPETLEEAFRGVERLLVISTDAIGRRVTQHRHAAEAAKRAGVGLLVYTSSVNNDREFPRFMGEHRATEAILRELGIPHAILRNNLYAEFISGLVAQVGEDGVLELPADGGKVAWVAREDCARAAAVVLTGEGHEGKVYDITGPVPLGFEEVAGLLGEVLDRRVVYRSVEPAVFRERMAAAGAPGPLVDLMEDLYRGIASGTFDVVSDDVARLVGRPPLPAREVVLRGV
ncbi:SDR family oxidoreductase [Spirochaeta thermophila]|uniref:NmrA-like domain-containing protein n=1 Tax=Winmispira thermophila (strain ATCC 49972 / DSM 6192 / RI 19.B1) TaxID=665571 RepID=E0RP54_WINT6|nr:SDR family oxidoreductase [Spirochaeta thermophila]ADN02716.1 hypothetical protein STHERM_c17810 [Spirochaeta thermophila DSM 6192]